MQLSSVVYPIPSSGLLSTSLLTGSRSVGSESSDRQAGMPTFFYGKMFWLYLLYLTLFTPPIYRLAFATYLVSMILFIFVISTGALFMLYSGLFMVFASFAYSIIIINDPQFSIPFADVEGRRVNLETHFGWAWILNLCTGCATVVLATLVLVLNFFFPREIATFFHHTIVEEDEFFQASFQSLSS